MQIPRDPNSRANVFVKPAYKVMIELIVTLLVTHSPITPAFAAE